MNKIDLSQYDYISFVDEIKVYSRIKLAATEAKEIVQRQCERVHGKPDCVVVDVEDGWLIAAPYFIEPKKFQRIRRITGYLVGTLDRFNDGKRSEVEDRLKHGI